MKKWILLTILLTALTGCCRKATPQYQQRVAVQVEQQHPYVLTLYANARGLDYSSGTALYRSLKFQEGRRETHGIFGHTWIRLKGVEDGQVVVIEGGHSGELGIVQPEYIDGVMQRVEKKDPNPVAYLWATQRDGFFQEGSGGHPATHRAVFKLTEEQYWDLVNYINPKNYDYLNYSIVRNQCVIFCARVAERVGVKLEHRVDVSIPKKVQILTASFQLWRDPEYSVLPLALPDVIVLNPCFEKLQVK